MCTCVMYSSYYLRFLLLCKYVDVITYPCPKADADLADILVEGAPDRYKFMHMPRQHRCHVMCILLEVSLHRNLDESIEFE